MANTHIRFNNDDDDDDDYNESESDEEFTSNEKDLLKKVQRNEQSDSDGEDEVFGVGSDSEDDDLHKSDLAESDIEGQEDEDLPDIRAWGKDKRKYYSTDYVDPDYGGFQGKDATLAELEEEEARNLQKQLVQQMDDDDFALDIFGQSQPDDKKTSEEVVKTDISKLSKRQKLEILKKESPELFGLLDDFKAKLAVAKDYLRPIIQLSKKNKIKPCKALQFVKIHYKLILNYCTNIQMYLLLKSSKVNVRNHPIAKRLYQYRQLLAQLESPYNEIIKPQLEMLLLENTEDQQETKKKTLNVLKKLSKHNAPVTDMEVSLPPRKKKKVSKADLPMVNSNVEGSENQDNSKNEEDMHEANAEHKETVESSSDVNAKRGITFEIAKNKGLTPHRKKEQRNPRVKHRMKFKKAKIRRKGAVREVRREISRYDGEISGIKASVTKSVKIKS